MTNSMYKPLITMLLVLLYSQAWAQFEKNYRPISFSGAIPAAVLQSAEEKTQKDLTRAEGELSEKQSKEFYSQSNYTLKNVLLSGSVYFNDELSAYVNRLTDHLLRDNPEQRKAVQVYVARFSSVNAASWRDGSLFINLGLIRRMSSEAQLAFVISHEISHYFYKHNLQQFKRQKSERDGLFNFGRGSDTERMFARLSYSRNHEYEADSAGFVMFAKAGYDLNEAILALQMLEESDNDKYPLPVDLSKYFETEKYKLDSSYVYKPQNEKKKKKSSGEVVIIDRSTLEALSTHPDIENRIEAIRRIAATLDSSKVGSRFIQPESDFRRITDIADFELIEKLYQDTDYGRSLYESFMLLEKYPDNEYLRVMIAKNMQWISYYKLIKSEKSVLDIDINTKNFYYNQFNKFIKSLPQDKLNKLTRGYITACISKYPKAEDLYIAEARHVELTENIGSSKKLYQAYIDKFPNGAHQNFAIYKTKQK